MSELLVVDEDPDPLPGARKIYPMNLETGLRYDGHELSEYLAELETRQQERAAVQRLCTAANRILADYREKTEGDQEDRTLRHPTEPVTLRRRRLVREEAGRIIHRSVYFFVDKTSDEDYCRSWSTESDRVGYCQVEERYEPAEDVEQRVKEAFEPCFRDSRFGRLILTLIRA